jgi:hypothetical protein
VYERRAEVHRQQLFAAHLDVRLEHARRHHSPGARRSHPRRAQSCRHLALAIDVTNLSEISFTIPLCLSGSVQLQTKMLSATVFFE